MIPLHARMVLVTNKNRFDFEDRFDGVTYRFPKNETVRLPFVCARHFFGYGLADKTDALRRNNWNNPVKGRGDGNVILNSFMIEEIATEGDGADNVPHGAAPPAA